VNAVNRVYFYSHFYITCNHSDPQSEHRNICGIVATDVNLKVANLPLTGIPYFFKSVHKAYSVNISCGTNYASTYMLYYSLTGYYLIPNKGINEEFYC